MGGPEVGSSAVAVFAPTAVAIHTEPPHGSPRNVIRTTIAELEVRGATVRVRSAGQPDGSPALFADVTPAATADLDLTPGREVYFVVKTMEIQIHPATAPV
jgi:molybdate transport system ATP-binding protein